MKHARPDYDTRIQDSAGLIPDDEPVLLVRAQDACALATIDAWLDQADAIDVDEHTFALVREHRQRILDWQAWHGTKVPDAPQSTP